MYRGYSSEIMRQFLMLTLQGNGLLKIILTLWTGRQKVQTSILLRTCRECLPAEYVEEQSS